MQDQLKIIFLGCMIYFVFGIVSFFQLGVFLPPIYLSPVFVGVFALILGIVNLKRDKKVYSYLILLGLAEILVSQFFLEIVMIPEEIIAFQDANIPDYLFIAIHILYTILLVYLSFQRIQNKIRFNILPALVIVAIWVNSFFPGFGIAEAMFILLGFLLFLVTKKDQENQELETLFGIKVFFIAVGALSLINSIALGLMYAISN